MRKLSARKVPWEPEDKGLSATTRKLIALVWNSRDLSASQKRQIMAVMRQPAQRVGYCKGRVAMGDVVDGGFSRVDARLDAPVMRARRVDLVTAKTFVAKLRRHQRAAVSA